MNGHLREDISTLLKSLFNARELRMFILYKYEALDHDIPISGSLNELAAAFVEKAWRHGLIDERFFVRLNDRFPRRRDDIEPVQRRWAQTRKRSSDQMTRPLRSQHLDGLALQEIAQAHIAASLNTPSTLDALQQALPQNFAATLETSGPSTVRLMKTLHKLNRTLTLLDGEVPLLTWLREASFLCSAHPSAMVFRRYAVSVQRA